MHAGRIDNDYSENRSKCPMDKAMSDHSPHASARFVLEAFDCDLWCPVAHTLLHVSDIEPLRSILGATADSDPELRLGYLLDDEELAALTARFGIGPDPSLLESADLVITLRRLHSVSKAPYLIHTRYELPLLLEGRKKLAKMYHDYPPMTFEGEDRFDHWVGEGLLHREEVLEPFDDPIGGHLGFRTVYYTLKGEEWRIPATKLIWEASRKSDGWNEYFERLEGMLYGYEDWQNDWHIGTWLRGPRFCCPVTASGVAWIEAAGFRALPPIGDSALMIASSHADVKAELGALMLNPDHVAVVGFNVIGRYVRNIVKPGSGPWCIEAERIAELNKNLKGLITIVAHRDGSVLSKRG